MARVVTCGVVERAARMIRSRGFQIDLAGNTAPATDAICGVFNLSSLKRFVNVRTLNPARTRPTVPAPWTRFEWAIRADEPLLSTLRDCENVAPSFEYQSVQRQHDPTDNVSLCVFVHTVVEGRRRGCRVAAAAKSSPIFARANGRRRSQATRSRGLRARPTQQGGLLRNGNHRAETLHASSAYCKHVALLSRCIVIT